MANKIGTIVKAIDESKTSYRFDDFETVEQLFDCANENSLLPQLYYLYESVAPQDSSLNKNRYHWKNLRSSMTSDVNRDDSLLRKIGKDFLDYYIDYGAKSLLILKFEDNISYDETISKPSLDLELTSLRNDDSLEIEATPLCILSAQKNQNYLSFIFHESCKSFSQETPSSDLLSEAGKQLKNQLSLKKATLIKGFHKLIIIDSFVVFLIDQTVLSQPEEKETAADKARLMATLIASRNVTLPEKRDFVYFFPAIEKLYEDREAGEVSSGYFTTSSGTKFNARQKLGVDLRVDPFQKGGIEAEPTSLSFTKLGLRWPDISGIPTCFLNGSGEMFNNQDKSLPSIEISFSTKEDGQANFLHEVLNYAKW